MVFNYIIIYLTIPHKEQVEGITESIKQFIHQLKAHSILGV